MDLNVKFPERPLHTRRDIMIKGIAGAVAVAGYGSRAGVALASVPGVAHGESPGVEEGPFWVDGQVQRVDMRPDSATGVYPAGLPLYIGLTISQLSDTAPYTIRPLVGARVDMWCCNAQGVYSDEASESTTGTNYLRGYQITNAHGVVNILANYPGWYSGRTPHVHIRIRIYNAAGTVTYNYASQMFFDETITNNLYASNSAYSRTTARDTTNSTDRVYNGSGANGSPATEAGDYLKLKLSADSSHAVASFHYIIDPSDTANADPTNGTETGNGGGTTGTGGSGGTPPTGTPPTGTPPTGTAPAIRTGTTGTTKSATKSSARSAGKPR